MTAMSRVVATLLTAGCAAFAQDILDPAFAKVPFDHWLSDHEHARFLWSAKVTESELAKSQRLSARVEITVDGNELIRRRGHGELGFFIQFTDSNHRRYQSHGAIPLKEVTDAAAKSNFVVTQTALITPGDYTVAVAIQDSETGDHSCLDRSLHVSALKNDPLPDSWEGLPSVEFLEGGDPPDSWFQPQLTGRLHLPLEPARETRVEVLANASPSAMGSKFRTGQANNRSLADVLPGLKVISEMELKAGTLNVSVLDLTRRQLLYTQEHVGPRNQLDWARLRPALLEADPNKIDVHQLADQEQNPQFFVEDVRKRLGTASAPSAIIVLSGPMQFAPGADLHPIELAERSGSRVFFIRFHVPPTRAPVAMSPTYTGRRRSLAGSQAGFAILEPLDSLEPLLKPLQPRVFDVYDPGQFRKTLAELMKEIGRM